MCAMASSLGSTDACRLIEATDVASPAPPSSPAALAVSPDRLRRAFTRVLGVTPRQYGDTLRRERLRAQLRDGVDVTQSLFTVGYGSTSRLYEHAHDHLGDDPGVVPSRR